MKLRKTRLAGAFLGDAMRTASVMAAKLTREMYKLALLRLGKMREEQLRKKIKMLATS